MNSPPRPWLRLDRRSTDLPPDLCPERMAGWESNSAPPAIGASPPPRPPEACRLCAGFGSPTHSGHRRGPARGTPAIPGASPAPAGMPPPAPVERGPSPAKRHAAATRLRDEQSEHVAGAENAASGMGAAEDVSGHQRQRVSHSYFNPADRQPIFHGGANSELAVGADGSVHVPVQTTGTVGAGTTRLFGQPLTPGGGGAGAGGALAPVTALGNDVRNNANTQNQIAQQKAAWAQQALDAQKQETALRLAASPLYQMKGILDQNGGQLPTGVGADKVMDFGSAANMITSLLGHQLDSAETPDKISSMQLLNKYGMKLQQAEAAGILPGNATNASLESAGHTSPGIGLSNTVNVHLIDNLTRMNDLRIKYAHDFQQYYKDNKGDMSDWNNAWTKSISGDDNSIPLSKYPTRDSTHPDGSAWGYYPSTDPSGFSWKPKSSVQ